MLTNSLRRDDVIPFNGNLSRPQHKAVVLPLLRRSGLDARANETSDRGAVERRQATANFEFAVEVSPPDIVKRRRVSWNGMAAEIVQAAQLERIESRFRAPAHLLIVGERGARCDGETFVAGLRSSLRDYRRKLTFVPAGAEYYDWQTPRTLTRLAYFYLDPEKLPVEGASVYRRRVCFSRIRQFGTQPSSLRAWSRAPSGTTNSISRQWAWCLPMSSRVLARMRLGASPKFGVASPPGRNVSSRPISTSTWKSRFHSPRSLGLLA